MITRRLPPGARVLALLALLATLLLAVAGCGSETASPTNAEGPDPASVAPAGALAYGEAVVRPTGDMEAGARAALGKVLGVDDPGAELRRLVDKALSEGGGQMSWARDAEPWLGQRIAFVASPPANRGEEPEWAVIAAIRDTAAYDEMVERYRGDGWFRPAGAYRGVAYDEDVEHDTGFSARVGDLAVTGTEAALRSAIDASSGGDDLAADARFTDAIGDVPDDALAFAYVDPKPLVEAARTQNAPEQARALLRRLAEGSPAIASLTANADEIAIEGSGPSELLDTEESDAEVSVGQLPGDSWLALATPPLGPLIANALDASGVHDEAAAQLRTELGLELDKDLLDPLGGLGLFVRGGSLLDIGGGALLQMTDAAAAQRLLTRIEAIVRSGAGVPTRPLTAGGARGFQVQIPQSPQPIVVLAKGDRLAAGYAASSALDLFDPQQRFDESSDGKAAIDTLGEGYEPSFVLIVPPLAGLLRSLDQLQVADLSSVLPYLEAYRSLAVGTKRDGDRTSVRIVAALR